MPVYVQSYDACSDVTAETIHFDATSDIEAN